MLTQQRCLQFTMNQMLTIYLTEHIIHSRNYITGSFFVVKAKSNLKCTFCKWKRRLPKNILSDAEVKLLGYTSERSIQNLQVIRFYDEEDDCEFTFLTNAKHISALDMANLYKKDGSWNCFSNG